MLAARPASDVRGMYQSMDESTDESADECTWDAVAYDQVPDPDAEAEVDPHWLQLRGESPLPLIYMPPAMTGAHAPWLRVMALVLISVFVAATATGICLTYGPPLHRLF